MAKLIILIAILLLLLPRPAHAWTSDTYGGANEKHCAGGVKAHFYTEKIGTRWWLCTPEGHGYFFRGLDSVNRGSTGNYFLDIAVPATACSAPGTPAPCCTGAGTGPDCEGKYWIGWPVNTYLSVPAQTNPASWIWNLVMRQVQRMKAWGFNGTADDSDPYYWPMYQVGANSWNTADTTIPVAFRTAPVIRQIIVPYAGKNINGCGQAEAIKDIAQGVPLLVANLSYGANRHLDFFDPKWAPCVAGIIAAEPIDISHNGGWLLGVVLDEEGQDFHLVQGPDYPRVRSVLDNALNTFASTPYDSWLTLVTNPVQASGPFWSQVYADEEMYTKVKFADYLVSVYSGNANRSVDPSCTGVLPSYCMGDTYIGADVTTATTALNLAWGSNYSTLGTSDAAHCAANLHTCLGGTGVPTYNKWGTGTGLIDEDGSQPSGAYNLGDACTLGASDGTGGIGTGYCGSPTIAWPYPAETAGMQTAMSNFEKLYLNAYMSTIMTYFVARFGTGDGTGILPFLEVGGYGAPPRREVLEEMAVNNILASFSLPIYCPVCVNDNQGRVDFIQTYLGDGPWLIMVMQSGNPDSAEGYRGIYDADMGVTQAARGVWYGNDISLLLNTKDTASSTYHIVGYHLWELNDMDMERINWGEIDNIDNPYDGVCDTAAGGTETNYGFGASLACATRNISQLQCRGTADPFTECTGVGTAVGLPNIPPLTYDCASAGHAYYDSLNPGMGTMTSAPWNTCCTGLKTGTCIKDYGNMVTPVTNANNAVYPTLLGETIGSGAVHNLGLW